VAEVAQLLEISRATAYRLIHERRLGHVRISNAVKVHVEQLRAYVREASIGAPSSVAPNDPNETAGSVASPGAQVMDPSTQPSSSRSTQSGAGDQPEADRIDAAVPPVERHS
jgi:excisionase family DNA binding protein